MRRQFVSNVAFYSTTAVLILIIVLCIAATVKSESRDETAAYGEPDTGTAADERYEAVSE